MSLLKGRRDSDGRKKKRKHERIKENADYAAYKESVSAPMYNHSLCFLLHPPTYAVPKNK